MSIVKSFTQTQSNNNIKPIDYETKNRNCLRITCHHIDDSYVVDGYRGTNKTYEY